MTDRSNVDLYDEPAYRATEAAHMLALPAGTVRAWSFGQDYPRKDGRRKRFFALIEPADPKTKLLSFNNLCELHTLGAIRRHYHVPMMSVRNAAHFVAEKLDSSRPFLSADFLTNGVHLFIERAGAVLNTSRQGQTALSPEFERELQRVSRNARGDAVQLFPATRDTPTLADQPKFVVIDPTLSFGRPVLAGAGIRTDIIQDRFLAGDSPRDMAEDYGVDEPLILEALRFEQRLAA